MAKLVFQLKRSRLAFVFQLSLFCVLIVLLYPLLSPVLWLGCLILALISYAVFLRQPALHHLEHLDEEEWSLRYLGSQQILRLKLKQVIDHRLYMVLYFAEAKTKPVVIWCDQLPLQKWKYLKQLAILA